jgi:hypothetical protein
MFKYQDSIEIGRPVADVFTFLIEAENFPTWVDTTVDAWQVSDGPVVLGTRQVELIVSPSSKSKEPLQLNWEISEFEKNQLISFESNTSWGYQKQSFKLDPSEVGTRLRVEGNHRFIGPRRFIQPVLGFFIRRERRKHLLKLKQILESGRQES